MLNIIFSHFAWRVIREYEIHQSVSIFTSSIRSRLVSIGVENLMYDNCYLHIEKSQLSQ